MLSTLCTIEACVCLHTLGIDAAQESTLFYSLSFQLICNDISYSREKSGTNLKISEPTLTMLWCS